MNDVHSRIDPIVVSVLAGKFESVCREIGETMLRTSRSPIFSEARDFVTGVFDRNLRLVAQQSYIPVQMGAMPYAIESIAGAFEADIHEGDVFILNDPYLGNNHPPDVTVAKPVFHNRELCFWAVSKGHHADIGGGGVAGYNPLATDVWEDALRIPPARLYHKGVYQKDLWNMILLNVHIPFLVEGDLHCQVGAVNMGERALKKLLDRYGPETLESACDEFLQAGERQMRKEIQKIPDGEYYGEQKIDHDGVDRDKRITIRLTVKVKGEEIIFDYTGTDPQTRGPFNSPMAATASHTYLAFFACLGPHIKHNEGSLRPIQVIAPEGCLLNPLAPAPTTCNGPITSEVGAATVWLALSKAIKEKVSAGWARWCSPATAGINPRTKRPFAEIHFLSKGGGGASQGHDGWDHITPVVCLGGLRSPDPELHEVIDPFFTLDYEYTPDSAGAGRWRGGLGVTYRFRVEADHLGWVNFGSGIHEDTAPFGLDRGKPAPQTRQYFVRKDGSREEIDVNCFSTVQKGDVCEIYTSGGGGFGDPFHRAEEKVLEDVINEVVSFEGAEKDYGVVVDRETLTVDRSATDRLRGRTGDDHGMVR